MRKAAIYTPYLDVFGGGERYMMTIAETLSSDFSVDILLDGRLQKLNIENIRRNLEKRFDLNLSKTNFVKAPFGKGSNLLSRILFLSKYHFLFCLTDGSLFFPAARKNILHIQSPIKGQPSFGWWGKFKLSRWNLIIYNSIFTKDNSLINWPLKFQIIYPPVDIEKITSLNKKNYILSVGRFFGYLKDKKQELMINVFKDLSKQGVVKGWSLHLVGSAGEGDLSYINKLKDLASGFPIKFYSNLDYDNLVKLYGESKIYWHASGFEEKDPTKMEHFGISTVEAMAGGCVPIVIGKGGQIEIVEQGKSGFLWSNIEELKNYTLDIIGSKDFDKISKKASERAKEFSKEKFVKKILGIINE